MSTKVALVTGGSRGLGFETARKLALAGYHVVLTARSREKADQAAAKIRALVPGAEVVGLPLDLASFASIHAFADAFHALGLPLHLLVDNAGFLGTEPKPSFTAEGFESTFGTNHLGHFLLTHLLVPDLVAAAPSRVVVVSSGMHKPGVGPGPGPDFDYENLKAEKGFDPHVAYRNSKLANLWFAAELDRRLHDKGVTVVAVSPGWVPETQAKHMRSGFQRFLFRNVLPHLPFARTLKQGSDNTVFAATDGHVGEESCAYYEDQKPGERTAEALDEAKAKQLWEQSLSLCHIDDYEHPHAHA
jgi:NAD(P)-dependent dehydrogenase (short-subunit alcohol dehydrogenase family)